MALELEQLAAPTHTAVVTSEVQRGVVGDLSALPELAAAARPRIPRMVRVLEAGRRAGAQIVHCTAERRRDGKGSNLNGRLFQAMARASVRLEPGSPAAQIIPEIEVHEADLVLSRLHGLSPFHGTELDWVLRNLGIRTLVAVGVSINVAIPALAFEAVSAGYQVVIPTDAVAGFPAEYERAVFAHTLGAITTLVTTDALLEAWRSP